MWRQPHSERPQALSLRGVLPAPAYPRADMRRQPHSERPQALSLRGVLPAPSRANHFEKYLHIFAYCYMLYM